MAENIQKSSGRTKNYKLDRGGTIADTGPFIGTITNNIDPTFSGRVQVYIEAFGYGDPDDKSLWRTVRYLPPFFGTTNPRVTDSQGISDTVGSFENNPQSYGMWFTPPDIGTDVLCFFVEGDPTRGYYVGCVPNQAANRMVPAIGAVSEYEAQTAEEKSYYGSADQAPVTEINVWNKSYINSPKFFDSPKPIHSYYALSMMQQGVNLDKQRGPITSSSQRDTPSTVYGVSTPGRPIYQGGQKPENIKKQLEEGAVTPQQAKIVARQGGHSVVMDDGDLEGKDALVRIRTAKGHQIMMNDEGNFFHIMHANGLTWIEFGVEGTVDVFSTNSVNVRTKGTMNFHADQDINIYAGGNFHVKSKGSMRFETEDNYSVAAVANIEMYSQATIGVLASGALTLKSATGAWTAGSGMKLQASRIDLNGGAGAPPKKPEPIEKTQLDDTQFVTNKGWEVKQNALKSIVTRAPTHEPYPYHNQGVGSVKA